MSRNSKTEDRIFTAFAIVAVVAVVVAAWLIATGLFYAFWIWVAVPVFRWPALTFWQCFLVMLVLWLIGGCFKSTQSTSK